MDLKLEVSFCERMGFKESELRCIGEERKGKSVRLSYTILKDFVHAISNAWRCLALRVGVLS